MGWITDAVVGAINAFFRGLVRDALNPLLDLLGRTLLSTPTPRDLPRIGELWTTSWQITLAAYGILVLLAGVLVASYESVQAQYSIKEIAPRVVLGFLASALSLVLAQKAIETANALSRAVMSDGVNEKSAGRILRSLVMGSLDQTFAILVGLVIAGMLLALLVTYAVRVALTLILVAGAPLALMCHALPQTDGIARWWWRVFGGLLAIQVAQSLTLITAIRVLLTPDNGFGLFGANRSGLANLIVSLALLYILIKIPFWILRSSHGSTRRSLATRVAQAYVATRVLGAMRSGGRQGGTRIGGARYGAGPVAPPLVATHRPGGAARSRTALRRSPGNPLFLDPTPPSPPGRVPANHPPPMPVFRAPGDPPSRPPTGLPQPTAVPGPPVFLPPGARPPERGAASRRRSRGVPPVPTRFQPPVVDPLPQPRRAHGSPPLPHFQEPVRRPPPLPPNPPRRFAPPPPFFSSPPPPRRRPGNGDAR
ncbi:hypothetical protein [Streptomyces sp. NPDC059009]|uniref:hypothetical protein n=1 Tax=Streptomyces sp. NPDC059009 TaxID=3346694 RepID=UPI0036C4FB41